ncbi:MAG: archaeal proteasome endopeptidase complex subunit alpha [Halobacteriaceae archaeon]
MRGQDQQAYDRGSAMFSPDGRIYQVEYAHEAVSQGAPSVAVRTPDGVVLAVRRRLRSPLLVGESVEKLHKIDDHIGIASTGHVADGRKLIEAARQQAQVNRLRYEEPISTEALTKALTDNIQEYTQMGGTRPFGVSLLIGGVEDGTPHLYEADPSGNPTAWKARAVGNNSSAAQEYAEEHYDDDAGIDSGIELALGALAATDDDELEPEKVAVAVVETATERFRRLDNAEVAARLSALREESNDGGDDA